eukprot:GHUV01051130.1.p2 GENE.GHUV01051130.1~~GHUV01051130.1.p2  ORF type:complete len:116 (+),score=12.59 GHUV01051130.1:257-604(+)
MVVVVCLASVWCSVCNPAIGPVHRVALPCIWVLATRGPRRSTIASCIWVLRCPIATWRTTIATLAIAAATTAIALIITLQEHNSMQLRCSTTCLAVDNAGASSATMARADTIGAA